MGVLGAIVKGIMKAGSTTEWQCSNCGKLEKTSGTMQLINDKMPPSEYCGGKCPRSYDGKHCWQFIRTH